jgi:helicase MOV-10
MLRKGNDELYEKLNDSYVFTSKVHSPVLWVNTCCEVKRDPKTGSLFNPGEASFGISLVKKLSSILGPDRIMYLSPYRQHVRISQMYFHIPTFSFIMHFQLLAIANQTADLTGLFVGTVDEVQGQERDIVVCSTVRSSKGSQELMSSSPLGFLSNPARINVIMSRGKQLVIFVGDHDHFYTSGVDYWTKIVERSQAVTMST